MDKLVIISLVFIFMAALQAIVEFLIVDGSIGHGVFVPDHVATAAATAAATSTSSSSAAAAASTAASSSSTTNASGIDGTSLSPQETAAAAVLTDKALQLARAELHWTVRLVWSFGQFGIWFAVQCYLFFFDWFKHSMHASDLVRPGYLENSKIFTRARDILAIDLWAE